MGNINEALAAIVKEKRKLRQITRTKLGEMVGCSQGQISNMLTGARPIKADMLEKLCAALEIRLSDLENWNPELGKVPDQRPSEAIPPELVRAQARLARLYEANKPAFAGVVGTIDYLLKQAKAEKPPAPNVQKPQ